MIILETARCGAVKINSLNITRPLVITPTRPYQDTRNAEVISQVFEHQPPDTKTKVYILFIEFAA